MVEVEGRQARPSRPGDPRDPVTPRGRSAGEHDPPNSGPSAVSPVSAPKTAIPRREVARAWSSAVTPESSTSVYFTISVRW